ncbi:hypothetical protein ACFQ0D_07675 [Micromonospora zhanjiangensis]
MDGRERGIHPLIVSPILLLTIFLSPFDLLGYLAVRSVPTPRRGPVGGTTEPEVAAVGPVPDGVGGPTGGRR